jgi:hypothetical protein
MSKMHIETNEPRRIVIATSHYGIVVKNREEDQFPKDNFRVSVETNPGIKGYMKIKILKYNITGTQRRGYYGTEFFWSFVPIGEYVKSHPNAPVEIRKLAPAEIGEIVIQSDIPDEVKVMMKGLEVKA